MKSIGLVTLAVALTAAACGSKKEKEAPAPATAPTAPIPPTSTTTAPAPAANTPHTTDHPSKARTAVVEGAACTTGLRPVTDVAMEIKDTTLHFQRDRGGGCPTRAVYTAFYTKANPVQVRVCEDPGADTCEMMIMGEHVTIDLAPALTAAGATSAVLVK